MTSTLISQNLIRLCRLKELTVQQLALKSGVSERTIERIRSGHHVPDVQTISKLEKALGQNPGKLVEGAVERFTAGPVKNIEELSEPERKRLVKDMRETLEELERKDFTKFERNMSKNQVVNKTIIFTAKERNEAELREKGDGIRIIMLESLVKQQHEEILYFKRKISEVKRQVILAVVLAMAIISLIHLIF